MDSLRSPQVPPTLQQLTDACNAAIAAEFALFGWPDAPQLSPGIVRVILPVMTNALDALVPAAAGKLPAPSSVGRTESMPAASSGKRPALIGKTLPQPAEIARRARSRWTGDEDGLRARMVQVLQAIAVDNVMPTKVEFNAARPSDLPNGSNVLAHLGIGWPELAQAAGLTYRSPVERRLAAQARHAAVEATPVVMATEHLAIVVAPGEMTCRQCGETTIHSLSETGDLFCPRCHDEAHSAEGRDQVATLSYLHDGEYVLAGQQRIDEVSDEAKNGAQVRLNGSR